MTGTVRMSAGVAALLVLTSCAAAGPEPIAASSNQTGVFGEAARDSVLAPSGLVEYRVAGDLPTLDSDAPAYRAAAVAVGAGDAARIAAAFGVAGVPAANASGWLVGPTDGSGPTVTLSADVLGRWTYGAPVATSCVRAEPDGSCPGAVPIALPSDEAATAAARQLLGEVGGSIGDQVLVARDEAGVTVEYRQLLGGLASPIPTTIRFAGGGEIAYAAGFLGGFGEADAYPRIGTAAALDRLRDGTAFPWSFAMVEDLGTPGATSDGSSGAGAGSTGDPGKTEPEPLPSGPIIEPEPIPEPTPTVVVITGVGSALWSLDGADGSVWLLPGYLFTTEVDGQAAGEQLVPALAPEFIKVADPAPQPLPATDDPAVSPDEPVSSN